MKNVTKINVKNETYETLKSVGLILERIDFDEPNFDLKGLDGNRVSSQWEEICKKYDIPKFLRSLTDEDAIWEKKVEMGGTVYGQFYHFPPEDLWDDYDALLEYAEGLDYDDVCDDVNDVYVDDYSFDITYNAKLLISPEVFTKLEDAKFQMKKYEVTGVFDKTLHKQPLHLCVDATSFEDAHSRVEEQLNDENVSVSNMHIRDVSEVA